MRKSTALVLLLLAAGLVGMLARTLFAPSAPATPFEARSPGVETAPTESSRIEPQVLSPPPAQPAAREEASGSEMPDPSRGDFHTEGRVLSVRVIGAETSQPKPDVAVALVEQIEIPVDAAASGAETRRFTDFDSRTAKTGQDGEAHYRNVRPGRYRVDIVGDHLEAAPVDVEFTAESDRTIEIRASTISILGAKLSGSVVDADGKPIANAAVALAPVEIRFDVPAPVRTDKLGQFVFPRIEVPSRDRKTCRLTVTASSPAYIDRDSRDVEIGSGANTLDRPLVLRERGGSIEGRIVDPDGRPHNGARVELIALDSTDRRAADDTTDVRGRFLLTGLHRGHFLLTCQGLCIREFGPIELGDHEDKDIGDVRGAERRVELKGVVVFEDGAPASQVSFTFRAADSIEVGKTDDKGEFSLMLCSAAPGDLAFSWRETSDSRLAWSHTEKAVNPGGGPLRITIAPAGLVLRLYDSKTRSTLEPRTVVMTLLDSRGDLGTYRSKIENGEYRLLTENCAPGRVALRISASGYRTSDLTFEIPRDGYAKREVLEAALEPE